MRIALVAQHGSPLTPATDLHQGLPAASVAAHARGLAKLGHRVTIYARRDSRALPGSAILAPRVTIEHVAAGPPAPLSQGELAANVAPFGDYLAQRWHRNPPDVVHAYFWTSGLAALAATRGRDIPVVQTFGTLGIAKRRHGDGADDARIRIEACLARSARAVLAGTSAEAAELVGMGAPRAAVTVVPCGVDTAEFTPEGPAARRNGHPLLLAVSPLDEYHGLVRLLQVLARIPDAELLIAGGPPRNQLRNDEAYQNLTGLAKKLGVANRLSFTGRVARDGLPALLRTADLLVSAARYDPCGAITIAAMACGTPVAAFAVGACTDAVLDGTTGLLVPPGRPDLLARRIRNLLASPLRLEAYGIAAADRAKARYSWDRITREILHVYEQCLRPAAARLAGVPG
jgi:glycosyltransferase involved in cell wall biosynthesis